MRTERDELRAQTKMMAQKRVTEGFVSGFMIFCFLTWVASFIWPDAMPDLPWYVYGIVIALITGGLCRLQYKHLLNG